MKQSGFLSAQFGLFATSQKNVKPASLKITSTIWGYLFIRTLLEINVSLTKLLKLNFYFALNLNVVGRDLETVGNKITFVCDYILVQEFQILRIKRLRNLDQHSKRILYLNLNSSYGIFNSKIIVMEMKFSEKYLIEDMSAYEKID